MGKKQEHHKSVSLGLSFRSSQRIPATDYQSNAEREGMNFRKPPQKPLNSHLSQDHGPYQHLAAHERELRARSEHHAPYAHQKTDASMVLSQQAALSTYGPAHE